MNDLSTMIKIMEYMSLGKPIVQFDLKEEDSAPKKLLCMPTTPISGGFRCKDLPMAAAIIQAKGKRWASELRA